MENFHYVLCVPELSSHLEALSEMQLCIMLFKQLISPSSSSYTLHICICIVKYLVKKDAQQDPKG